MTESVFRLAGTTAEPARASVIYMQMQRKQKDSEQSEGSDQTKATHRSLNGQTLKQAFHTEFQAF